jgi:hypothetical protein
MAKASNVTKFDAGGSGDNIISDGYIKTVEKVWIDSYTLAFTNTNTVINIAVLPANKKITSIDLVIETTASQTNGTISVGFSTDSNTDVLLKSTAITHNITVSSIRIPTADLFGAVVAKAGSEGYAAAAFQKVTGGTQTTVAVRLNNWTMTTGTLKSIVRYT